MTMAGQQCTSPTVEHGVATSLLGRSGGTLRKPKKVDSMAGDRRMVEEMARETH